MAEVSQKLGNGAYRLSALRTGHTRPVSTGRGSGTLSVRHTFSQCPFREHSMRGRREEQPVSERRTTRRKSRKLWTVSKSESHFENGVLLCATSHETRFIGFYDGKERSQALPAAHHLPSVCIGRFQEKLLPSRRTLWTSHPAPPSFPQHPRAICTIVFILAREQPGRDLRLLRSDAFTGPAARRHYSWSSGETPLLDRSRTAYYDILKVSPTATQSQIKTAYYKQSFIYHPDKNPGNDEASLRFSAVSEAYTVLGNISLRRKYDRGILSQSDIQSAGRPSSKEHTHRSTGSSQQQQRHQRARQFTQAGGKPMFDFDAFYQAHYGEQLQREREMKARKQKVEEMRKKGQKVWTEQKKMELTLTLLVTMGGLIFISLLK